MKLISEETNKNLTIDVFQSERLIDRDNAIEFLFNIIDKMNIDANLAAFVKIVNNGSNIEHQLKGPLNKESVRDLFKKTEYDYFGIFGQILDDSISLKIDINNECAVTVVTEENSLIDLSALESEIK